MVLQVTETELWFHAASQEVSKPQMGAVMVVPEESRYYVLSLQFGEMELPLLKGTCCVRQ